MSKKATNTLILISLVEVIPLWILIDSILRGATKLDAHLYIIFGTLVAMLIAHRLNFARLLARVINGFYFVLSLLLIWVAFTPAPCYEGPCEAGEEEFADPMYTLLWAGIAFWLFVLTWFLTKKNSK